MTSLEPRDLLRVRIPRLDGDRGGDGWLWLPGGPDPHTLGLTEETPVERDDPPSPPRPGSGHVETVNARTYIRGDQHNHYYGGRP